MTFEEFLTRDELFKSPLKKAEKEIYIRSVITHQDYVKSAVEFARMNVKAALKEASESMTFAYEGNRGRVYYNVYPTENIK